MRVATLMLALVGCTENNLIPSDGPALHVAPAIAVDPEVLDLGRLNVGAHTTSLFRITNLGTAELNVKDVVMTRFAHRATLHLNGTPLLPPQGSVDVTVNAEAVVVGKETGIIRISSNDPAHPKLELPVTLIGVSSGTPHIRIEPLSHDFGVVSTSSTAVQPVTVTNTGDAPLTVTGLAWASSSASELRLSADGKLTAGAVLAPGETRALEVDYLPDDANADEASLLIYSDDPDLPEANADFFGDGQVLPDSTAHFVEMWLTADDQWSGTLDGVDITGPNAAGWGASDYVAETLSSGDHVVAIHAWDVASAVSGFVAVVKVDGVEHLLTGDSRVRMSTSKPPSGWESPTYDDSAWTTPKPCSSTSAWGGAPATLFKEGAAKWIWTSTDCSVLGEAWFRLPITLP